MDLQDQFVEGANARLRHLERRVSDLAEVTEVNITKVMVLGELAHRVRHSRLSVEVKNTLNETLLLALDKNDPKFWSPLVRLTMDKVIEQFAKWAKDGTLLPVEDKVEESAITPYMVKEDSRRGKAKRGAV